MLVLSRKCGEQVVIGDQIVVTVTQINKGKVRIGIDAPRDISIMRGELAGDPEVEAFRRHWMESDRESQFPSLVSMNLTQVDPLE
jgi:carbon storage regulator